MWQNLDSNKILFQKRNCPFQNDLKLKQKIIIDFKNRKKKNVIFYSRFPNCINFILLFFIIKSINYILNNILSLQKNPALNWIALENVKNLLHVIMIVNHKRKLIFVYRKFEVSFFSLCMMLVIHCKNFPKRCAWLSVTFLGFISFEQVTGNNRFCP